MKKHFLKVTGVLLIGFLMFSCSKEKINTEEMNYNSEDNSTYRWLIDQGFKEQDIQVFENHFIVENDMLVEKTHINKVAGLQSSNSSSQRINVQTPRDSNVDLQIMDNTEVSFYIYPDMPQMFIDASLLAIERWNEVLNNIELTVTTNKENADTEILLDSQEIDSNYDYVYPMGSANGLATWGSSSGPGKKIWINEAYNFGVTNLCWGESVTNEDKLTATITHEIGHILAFLHTDSWDGIHIEGSMSQRSVSDDSEGEEDVTSIMNSVTCGQNFSEGDIKAIENIYGMPDSYYFDIVPGSSWRFRYEMMTYPYKFNFYGYLSSRYGSYLSTPYDGSFSIAWDLSSITPNTGYSDFVRVEIYLYPNGNETSPSYTWIKVYDKWIYKYNYLSEEFTYLEDAEYGITLPIGHYEYKQYDMGRMVISYNGYVNLEEFVMARIDYL